MFELWHFCGGSITFSVFSGGALTNYYFAHGGFPVKKDFQIEEKRSPSRCANKTNFAALKRWIDGGINFREQQKNEDRSMRNS